MRHYEEYYTCDRCGETINPRWLLGRIPLKKTQVFDLNTNSEEIKAYLSGATQNVSENEIELELTEYSFPDSRHYHLCYKCHEEFKRFMRNESN